ncbi:hypothetical protein HU200_016755 [Digitaria exilis]|uniref:Bifunctional inhibitor/plant lipid transfer protein/seed storage helical domain-containing protein n=1 Tax=Digitaria exilis TaxID=1010633 RepID=A0A835KI50_9POAL|nr:hypothetical protein HU200_016755 [Digitaria exilis]
MFCGKLALFILLVYAITSPHLVNGVKQTCSKAQKVKLLCTCYPWIKHGFVRYYLPPNSPCCAEVRKVRNMDMNCVALMLSPKDRETYDVEKIRGLQTLCQLHSPPPSRRTKDTVKNSWIITSLFLICTHHASTAKLIKRIFLFLARSWCERAAVTANKVMCP